MNSGPGAAILESKFRPPPARPGIIPRTALVDRMLTHDAEHVVTLVAPPGYGKTTVLAQWSKRRGHKIAWVTVDKDDNDPSVLLTAIAAALARIPLLDPETVDSVTAGGSSISTALGRLAPSLMATSQPVTLVFDHVEAVDNPEARDVFAELAWRLPPGFRLALATRTQPPLPLPLLRSHRDVLEVGVDELAMDRQEAQLLLTGLGGEFSDDEVQALVEQTEGWPVGLYLAALASRRRGHAVASGVAFSGDDRLMRDYLRSEVLSRIDPSTVEFLTRTSVLDHLSGPLCDAVLDANGSQAVLEALEGSNLLLVPLDRHREQYRYHHLFRDLLAAELRREEPELVPLLHARAAQWLEANHLPEAAIGHAQAARDPDRVARLVTVAALPAYSAGHATTVRRWFEWFRVEGLVDRYPEVAVLGAVVE